MDVQSLSAYESTLLSKINEGYKTFEDLQANVPFSEKILHQTLESLIAKHVLILKKETKEYDFDSAIDGEKVILDGNLMLPTTIIKTADKLLICRGEWYSFPLDFDVRRIIWNVKLPSKTNSTLVELIKESVLKERKSRIKQSTEYPNLPGKYVPYNDHMKILLGVVGDDITEVTMIFFIKLYINKGDNTDFIEFRGFTVKAEIKTEELITELRKPSAEQVFTNIEIPTCFNFSDFVFSNNEIPYNIIDDKIHYVKITGIRSKMELTYYSLSNTGQKEKLDSIIYTEMHEGIAKLRDLFSSFANSMLLDAGFSVELSEQGVTVGYNNQNKTNHQTV